MLISVISYTLAHFMIVKVPWYLLPLACHGIYNLDISSKTLQHLFFPSKLVQRSLSHFHFKQSDQSNLGKKGASATNGRCVCVCVHSWKTNQEGTKAQGNPDQSLVFVSYIWISMKVYKPYRVLEDNQILLHQLIRGPENWKHLISDCNTDFQFFFFE